MTPTTDKNRQRLEFAVIVIALVAAFYCFWQAAATFHRPPFADAQWRLMGWAAVAVAGGAWWKSRWT